MAFRKLTMSELRSLESEIVYAGGSEYAVEYVRTAYSHDDSRHVVHLFDGYEQVGRALMSRGGLRLMQHGRDLGYIRTNRLPAYTVVGRDGAEHGHYTDIHRARARVDSLDNDHGSYAHVIRWNARR